MEWIRKVSFMQWLIDIIKEWVQAQGYALESWVEAKGYLTTGFVDRGDPVDEDFDITDFTCDNTWRELDLSAIVPAGAKAVSLYFTTRCSVIQKYWSFRNADNVNLNNISRIRPQIANFFDAGDFTVPVSTNRKIHYNCSDGCVWTVFLTVKGWWL